MPVRPTTPLTAAAACAAILLTLSAAPVFSQGAPASAPRRASASAPPRGQHASASALHRPAVQSPASAPERANAGSRAGTPARTASGVRVPLGDVAIDVALVAPDVVRVRVAPPAALDRPVRSFAVVPERPAAPAPTVTIANGVATVAGAEVSATVTLGPAPRVTVRDADNRIVVDDDATDPLAWDAATGAVRVSKHRERDELYYGFGEKALPLERQSRTIVNWNSDTPAYRTGTDPIYQTTPFYLGVRKGLAYGLFFDNTYRSWFDVANTRDDRVSFGASGGWADYYVFAGGRARDARRVVERYTELTGRTPMPPRWAVGYQQSRWGYYPEAKVRDIAGTFRRLEIPCDAIYLDIDYMDGYRVFTWDKSRFPDPAKLVADLRADGFHTVVIIDPGIKADPAYDAYASGRAAGVFVRTGDGRELNARVWPGVCAFPDFTDAKARDWWAGNFAGLVRTGVAGFWNDMNEPATFLPDDFDEPWTMHHPLKTFPTDALHANDRDPGPHARFHNVYGQQMTRATREGALRFAPELRPFVLTRASYAGGQRYSYSWTGDNAATWEHLQLTIPMLLDMGLSGQAMVGADIGGFIGGSNPELYTRWLEAASLTPMCRTHSDTATPPQEPWSYGDTYTAINRRSVELRYRLMPYLYGLFEEAERTGLPVMRPLWLDHPSDRNAFQVDNEYMVGRDLLVAPVLEPTRTARRVYLPAGDRWVDWWTGAAYEGGKDYDVEAPLDRLPLFARAGSAIPTQPVARDTGAQRDMPVTLRVFAGAAGEARLYEDAGDGFGYRSGESAATRVAVAPLDGGGVRVGIYAREGSYRSKAASMRVELVAPDGDYDEAKAGLGAGAESRDANGARVLAWTVPNDGAARTLELRPRPK